MVDKVPFYLALKSREAGQQLQTQPSLVRTLASQLRESRLWPRNPSTVSPRLNSLLFWGLCVTIISSSQLPYDNLREGPNSGRDLGDLVPNVAAALPMALSCVRPSLKATAYWPD